MKNLMLAVGLLLSAPVMADAPCSDIEQIATATHEARNSGVAINRMLEINENIGGGKIVESIIFSAYERPRYRTPENVVRDRQEFVNEWVMKCLRQRRD